MQADRAAKQAGAATTFLHVWWLGCGLKGCPPLLFIVDNRGPEATGWPHVLVEGALQPYDLEPKMSSITMNQNSLGALPPVLAYITVILNTMVPVVANPAAVVTM